MSAVSIRLAALVVAVAAEPLSTYTVYHANPLSEGPMPFNMDTADQRGEMFFDLGQRSQPLACAKEKAENLPIWARIECLNPEEIAPDLVISKLTLTVKQPFGEYARCNICNATGVDPLSQLQCQPGKYLCSCGHFWDAFDCNSLPTVGYRPLSDMFGKGARLCSPAQWMDAPYTCWGPAVARLTGGTWFSTTKAGWCDAPGANAATCSWRASVIKVVNKTCSDSRIHDAIEAYDARPGHPNCFDQCRPPFDPLHPLRPRPFVRNATSACWIYCYYATLLGESGLLPNGNFSGIPMQLLDEAFERPFLPQDQGGCPALPAGEPRAGPPAPSALAWQAYRTRAQRDVFGRDRLRPAVPPVADLEQVK